MTVDLADLLFLKKPEQKPTIQTCEDTPEQNPEQPLLGKLDKLIDLSEKKIYNNHIPDNEKRQWSRILTDAIRTYSTLLPQRIEATSTHTERRIILQMWKPIDGATPNSQI